MATKMLNRPSDDAGYAAKLAKKTELQTGRNAATANCSRIEAEMESPRHNETAALRLLGEVASDPVVSYETARQEVAAYERALEIHERDLAESHAKLSQQIAEQKKPEYKAIIKKMAVALTALREVALEESQFRDKAIQDDWSFSGVIRPMSVRAAAIRSSDDLVYIIDCWHKEAKEYGLL